MVNYTDYKIMANNISYWLIKNNKKIKTRKEYNLAGKEKKSLEEIKKTILKSKNTSNSWGRKFLEAAVVDNADTSLFPKYVSYKGKNYDKAEYIYMAKYVIAWWKKKPGKAPTTVPTKATKSTSQSKASSSAIIKKYGRSTNKGCDNRGQNTGFWCACHMAQEIIRNLTGIVIPQSKIASIMGTTTSGTGHPGIDTFFAWFNRTYTKYKLEWTWKNFSELGWNGIKKILESKNQDAGIHEKYRDEWGHYTNFDKIYDSTIDVHNSLGDKCTSSCYCGYTENRTKSTAKRYISGISQKSVLVVTRVK